MKLFRDYTYHWWQVGIFKLAMVCVGVLVGAYFAPWVLAHITYIWFIAVISLVYVSYISLFQ